jgi:hypothetical protein
MLVTRRWGSSPAASLPEGNDPLGPVKAELYIICWRSPPIAMSPPGLCHVPLWLPPMVGPQAYSCQAIFAIVKAY